jgi:hypothetical protein
VMHVRNHSLDATSRLTSRQGCGRLVV